MAPPRSIDRNTILRTLQRSLNYSKPTRRRRCCADWPSRSRFSPVWRSLTTHRRRRLRTRTRSRRTATCFQRPCRKLHKLHRHWALSTSRTPHQPMLTPLSPPQISAALLNRNRPPTRKTTPPRRHMRTEKSRANPTASRRPACAGACRSDRARAVVFVLRRVRLYLFLVLL
jgi:hypothetical protein